MKLILGTRVLHSDERAYNLARINWVLLCPGCGEAWGKVWGGEGHLWLPHATPCKRCPGNGERAPGTFFTKLRWWAPGVGQGPLERLRLAHQGVVDWQGDLLRASPELLRYEFEVWMRWGSQPEAPHA